MKKLLSLLAIGTMLIATACSDDAEVSTATDEVSSNTSTVTFTLNTSGSVQSRSYSDGLTATTLYYAVYQVDTSSGELTLLTELSKIKKSDAIEDAFDGGLETADGTVSFNLVNGNTYSVLFWAQSPNAKVFTLDFKTDESNPTLTIDNASLIANTEKYDAFFRYYEIGKVTGDIDETIYLYRPFAQLNFGTNDYDDVEAAGVKTKKLYTEVKVTGLNDVLNLRTGKTSLPSSEVSTTVTYQAARRSNYNLTEEDDDYETFPVTGYEYLSMNYLLFDEESSTVDVTLTIPADADNNFDGNEIVISQVPVQRNYRTNIYGSLLTSTVDYTVVKVPTFDAPDFEYEYPYVAVSSENELTAALESDEVTSIVLLKDISLSDNEITTITSDKTLDLYGNTLTQGSTSTRNICIASGTTLTITDSGSDGTITSENATGSYGLFDVYGGLIIEGGTFVSDGGDNGAMIKGRPGGTVIIEGGDFTILEYESFSSSQAGNYAVRAEGCAVSITGGTYTVGENCWGAIKLESCYGTDGDEVEISGVTITTVNTAGIELQATDAVISDATIEVSTLNSYFSTAIAICHQSKVTVNSGTYSGPYAVYIYSTGGYAYLNDGTYTGTTAVLKADDDTYDNQCTDGRDEGSYIYVYDGYYSGSYTIGSGGTYKTLLEISGGYFSEDPSDYLATGSLTSSVTDDDTYKYMVGSSSGGSN